MPPKSETPKVTNRYYQRVSSASVESEDGKARLADPSALLSFRRQVRSIPTALRTISSSSYPSLQELLARASSASGNPPPCSAVRPSLSFLLSVELNIFLPSPPPSTLPPPSSSFVSSSSAYAFTFSLSSLQHDRLPLRLPWPSPRSWFRYPPHSSLSPSFASFLRSIQGGNR